MMRYQVESEFAKFHRQVKKLLTCGYQVSEEIKDGYVISKDSSTEIDLTLMAIIHGDEVAGLVVLNEVVELLLNGFPLSSRLALVLGNYSAALQGQRFIDRDLNRCFGTDDRMTLEGLRANEIRKILARTRYLIDFHQTGEKSANCFSIFPYSKKNILFSQTVNKHRPIVTRFDDNFSSEGMCSDEFVLQRHNTAITIELGQKGFAAGQLTQGTLIAYRALHFTSFAPRLDNDCPAVPIYVCDRVVPYPDSGDCKLDTGLYNFKEIAAGERIGVSEGKVVRAEKNGYILFPKYRVRKDRPPREICHVLTEASTELLKNLTIKDVL